jgi:hypothetical protein
MKELMFQLQKHVREPEKQNNRYSHHISPLSKNVFDQRALLLDFAVVFMATPSIVDEQVCPQCFG